MPAGRRAKGMPDEVRARKYVSLKQQAWSAQPNCEAERLITVSTMKCRLSIKFRINILNTTIKIPAALHPLLRRLQPLPAEPHQLRIHQFHTEPLKLGELLFQLRSATSHHNQSHASPLPFILISNFSDGNIKLISNTIPHSINHLPLLLQRLTVRDMNFEFGIEDLS